jgi:hypothetical protein
MKKKPKINILKITSNWFILIRELVYVVVRSNFIMKDILLQSVIKPPGILETVLNLFVQFVLLRLAGRH